MAKEGEPGKLLRLEKTIEQVVGLEEQPQFTQKGFLLRELAPYLKEFPNLVSDIDSIRRINQAFTKPVEIPYWMGAMGTSDIGQDYAQKERDRQIRRVLELSKIPTREKRVAKLIELKRTEIHLPSIYFKKLSRKELRELIDWANSLPDDELTDTILKERERLDEIFKDQWPGSGKHPPGLAMP